MKKLVVYYDETYDREIKDAVDGTPQGRRAERFRELIRLGLRAEREINGHTVSRHSAEVAMERTTPQEPESSRKSRSLQFVPPST